MSTPSQVVTIRNAQPPAHTFLSRPPPPKTRPTAPLPAIPTLVDGSISSRIRRARSNTTLAIAGWAAGVHPGSPETRSPSPRLTTPRRRTSLGRAGKAARSQNATVICLSPTASPAHTQFSFTAVSPTVFPTNVSRTAEIPKRAPLSPLDYNADVAAPILQAPRDEPPAKPASRGLKSFRSLSSLRKRSKSTTAAPPPVPAFPSSLNDSDALSDKQAARAVAIAQRKRAAYTPPSTKEPPAAGPLSLHAEAQLAQFVDGGKLRKHANALVQAESGGVAYKDAAGVYWHDEDEAWEAQHLLAGAQADQEQYVSWVAFGKDWDAESVSSAESGLNGVAVAEARIEDLLLPRLRFAPSARAQRLHAQRKNNDVSAPTATKGRRAGRRPPPLTMPLPVYDLPEAFGDSFNGATLSPALEVAATGRSRAVSMGQVKKPSVMRFLKFAVGRK